jgi:hypothetical protein
MRSYPVSSRVNSVVNDDEACSVPVELGEIQNSLFSPHSGVAAFLAIWIDTVFTGPGHQTAILTAAFAGVVGAAPWAQYVEGSPQLPPCFGCGSYMHHSI